MSGLLLGFCLQLHGQNFVNLDFESANLPVIPAGQSGGFVLASDALPGWQVFYGTDTTPVATVLHNDYTLGMRSFSILGPNFNSAAIIEGQFTAFLQAANPGVTGISNRNVAIAQTGLVPNLAQSLQFKVPLFNQIGVGFHTNFFLSLNGQTLSLIPLDVTATYASYGVDVTSFAGQVADLRFTSFGTPLRPDNSVSVDSFQFSNTAVPEPGMWALLGLGAAGWCAVRRRRK